MSKKTKIIFIFILFLIFIFGGLYIILRAYGFVLDFKKMQLIKTGALYVKYKPLDAKVKLNGIYQKDNKLMRNILGSGIFISDLLPGTYTLEVTKENYNPWIKKVNISPTLVTAHTFIHLFPKNWEKDLLSTSTLGFWLTPKGLIFKKDDSIFLKNIKIKGNEILLSDFYHNFILTKEKDKFYILDINNFPTSTYKELIFKEEIINFIFNPHKTNSFLAISKKNIYDFNFENLTTTPFKIYPIKNNQKIINTEKEIFIVEEKNEQKEKNEIYLINFFSREKIKIDNVKTKDEIKKIISSYNYLLFFTNDNAIYKYDFDLKTTTPILEKTKINIYDIYLSPDGKRLVILPQNEQKIYIVAMDNLELDKIIKEGEFWEIKTKNYPQKFFWTHLLNYGIYLDKKNNLYITELDNTPSQNSYLIDSSVNEKYLYFNEYKIYFLQKENVYFINFKNITNY